MALRGNNRYWMEALLALAVAGSLAACKEQGKSGSMSPLTGSEPDRLQANGEPNELDEGVAGQGGSSVVGSGETGVSADGEGPGEDQPSEDGEGSSDEQTGEDCGDAAFAACLDSLAHECEGAEHPDACAEELHAICARETECTHDEPPAEQEGGDECGDAAFAACLDGLAHECEGAEHPEACQEEIHAICAAETECANDEPPAEDMGGDEPPAGEGGNDCGEAAVEHCVGELEHECDGVEHREACIQELRGHCASEIEAACANDEPPAEEGGDEAPPAEEGGDETPPVDEGGAEGGSEEAA